MSAHVHALTVAGFSADISHRRLDCDVVGSTVFEYDRLLSVIPTKPNKEAR